MCCFFDFCSGVLSDHTAGETFMAAGGKLLFLYELESGICFFDSDLYCDNMGQRPVSMQAEAAIRKRAGESRKMVPDRMYRGEPGDSVFL